MKLRFSKWRAIGGAVALSAAGVLLVSTALAQTPTPTAQSNTGSQLFQSFVSGLASKLGKTEGEVSSAIAQTQQELIDQAAQQGRIPAETADRLRSRLQNGPIPFSPVPKGHHGMRGIQGIAQAELSELATFLGLSPQELMDQLRSGKSLAQIAQEHGKSRDELKGQIVNAVQERLQQAVANSRLTQEQADNLLSRLQNNLDRLIDATPGMMHKGRFGRPGPQGTPTPSATQS